MVHGLHLCGGCASECSQHTPGVFLGDPGERHGDGGGDRGHLTGMFDWDERDLTGRPRGGWKVSC